MRRNLVLSLTLASLAAAESTSRTTVSVDPRFELMAVVQVLANYRLASSTDTAYRRDVMSHFAAFQNHPAVRTFVQASLFGYSFDGPPSTFICLSNPPQLELQVSGDCGAARIGGEPNLRQWLNQLRDFSSASRFLDFFEQHQPLYDRLIEETRARLTGDPGAELEQYCGVRQASFGVILSPLVNGNYGLRVPQSDGSYAVSANLSTAAGAFRPLDLRMLLWHEFGHSFTNPAIEGLRGRLNATAGLFPAIEAKMATQAYGSWFVTVIEHVVRTLVARLAAIHVGGGEGEWEVRRQRALGFAYLPALYDRIQELEQDRDAFPTFADFAPRLVDVFDRLAQTELPPSFFRAPYAGTINSVTADRSNLVVVLPTAEADSGTAIREYVEAIRGRVFQGVRIIDDVEALSQDLSANNVVSYGTWNGNLWLRQIAPAAPAIITDGRVAIGDRQFSGSRLRLIVSFPNPADPDSGVLAYTAANAADLVGINAVFHGPTGFVVADGSTVLHSGNYRLENGVWIPD